MILLVIYPMIYCMYSHCINKPNIPLKYPVPAALYYYIIPTILFPQTHQQLCHLFYYHLLY